VGLALILGLASSVCWGVADFYGGLQARRLAALAVAAWSQLAGGLLLGVVLLASGTRPAAPAVAWGFAAGLCGALGVLAFYRGLAIGVMSIVAPIAACGAVIPLVVSYALGQVPTPLALGGIAVALVGVVLVSIPSEASSAHPAGRHWPVLGLALVAALGFGSFFVCLHQGAAASGGQTLWTVGAGRLASVTALLAALGIRDHGWSWPGPRIVPVALIGVADTTANVLFTFASLSGNLAVVSVVGSLYPVATVLLARVVLAERLGPPQTAGVGLALAGVGLMSLG
jgi:drug/metabolite transporter (DMT)-like permease